MTTNDIDIAHVHATEDVEVLGQRYGLVVHVGRNVWLGTIAGRLWPTEAVWIYYEHPKHRRAGDPHMAPKGGRRGETISGDVPDKEAP